MKSKNKPTYDLLIKLLREARISKNISQAELSNLIEADQTYISKYETLERRIDFVEVREICKALKIPLKDFISSYEEELKKHGYE